jgi:YbbR domain-containing protein
MKEKLTKNIGLKILSVILAAILWLVIMNVDDPEETKEFTNVKVQVVNPEAITSLGKQYVITEGEFIDFTVSARRTIKDRLRISDFVITADFSELSITQAVPINITCPKYGDDVTIVDGKNENMKISLEDVITEQFKVTIVQKGEAAMNYHVGEKSATPNMIEVTGPRAKIDRIAEVVVDVNVTGMFVMDSVSAKPKALGKDGKEIDSDNLTFSAELVDVTIKIYQKKKISLIVNTSGDPASGYGKKKIEFKPDEIEIAGEEEVLKKVNSLPITIDITGAKENIEDDIDLQAELNKLQEGLIIVGEDKTAVNIIIEKMETKDLSIWPTVIEPRNIPDDLTLTYITTGPVPIKVMGLPEVLNSLTSVNIKPYFDLSNYSPGTYTLAFGLDKSNNVILLESPLIYFELAKKNATD